MRIGRMGFTVPILATPDCADLSCPDALAIQPISIVTGERRGRAVVRQQMPRLSS